MSALAGIWHFNGKPGADKACARQLAAQAIYGPHGESVWDDGAIALGRCLFQILPEDVYDRQPLAGCGGRYMLVADLRLDNREDIARELQIPGERARTLSDADILMSAWERWQEQCFDHLVGDYAFALWDAAERRLVLVRDPAGMRPLHYHRGKDFFAFASMPKGLHALPDIPRAPDEERIAEFLALLPEYGPRSFFKDIERVESGHVTIVTANGVSSRRYWEPQRKTVRLKNADEYAEGLRHHLDQAVLACLRGGGDMVGAHLSSGFDSSAVATSAALQMAPSGGKVVAFTSVPREGYDGPVPRGRVGDEGPIAAKTAARHPNIVHELVRTTGRSPLDNLDRNFLLYDRPVLNLCNATWTEAINDAARARKLSVLLSGQMGNMNISYDGLTLLPQLIRSGRWLTWLREGAGVVRNRHLPWRGLLAHSFGPFAPDFAWRWASAAFGKALFDVGSYSGIRAERLAELDMPARARACGLDLAYRPRKDGFETYLWMLGRIDMGNYNKGILGGWGIDCRDPTADRRLLSFCWAIPEDQFLQGGVTKALGRRAFAGRVAPEVINARGKGYQFVDWHEALTAARGALREEVARLNFCAPAATAIDLQRLAHLIEQWPDGGWETEQVMVPYRLALLRAVSTGHFTRKASGSNA